MTCKFGTLVIKEGEFVCDERIQLISSTTEFCRMETL